MVGINKELHLNIKNENFIPKNLNHNYTKYTIVSLVHYL